MRRILWFRRDLRVHDNPLLALSGEVLPVFIFDTQILSKLKRNDRRVTFIFHAVMKLKKALKERGLDLAVFYGNPVEVFTWILKQSAFDEVAASGDYDSYARERDRQISHLLPFSYLHDTYIFAPTEILKDDKTPYQVFTPFYNKAKTIFTAKHLHEILPSKQRLLRFEYTALHQINNASVATADISFESIGFDEQTLLPHLLRPAQEKLEDFSSKIATYAHDREYLSKDASSGLSTDLRFGTIGIREILRWLVAQKKEGINTEPFFRQLVFRDFYAILLYHFAYLQTRNFRYRFNGVENDTYFQAFCNAKTGVPIIDAGIRQLVQTGEMHNRVRMITASFFTKNLLLPWQWGESFFAEHLIDYDASANILSWQWSAGTGVDPQPYFRIFNPYAQSKKFDKEGVYIKQYLPELAAVPPAYFADEQKLYSYKPAAYPEAIVKQKESAQKALAYFKNAIHQ